MNPSETEGFPPEPELDLGLLPKAEPAKNPVDIGQVAYEAYAGYVGWQSVRGEQLPGYSEQVPRIQNAWRMAAEAVVEADREAVPFGAPIPDGSQPSAASAEPPAGKLARVEVKGFRDLGIVRVTESTLAGEAMLRAESADGAVAEFPASSLHFITWLPEGTQVRAREPAAIPAGDPWGRDVDEPDDWDERNPF